MSQAELAADIGKSGVSVSTVQKWESGRHFPGRHLGSVEQVLGVRLDDEPRPAAIEPQDDHERFILELDTLGDDDKRLMIRSYRRAKARYGPEPAPAPAEDRSPGQAAAS